jgi:16S rRNA (adenine1518-N6/adenine1519-N6)-dimethyltransferase
LTDIREKLKALKVKPLKRFGQNFLRNEEKAREVARVIALEAGDLEVLEIGPGAGALTRPLLDLGLKLTAAEIDKTLADYLRSWPEAKKGRLMVLKGDALGLKREDLPGGPFLVCGSLPYNISSPLIFWFTRIFKGESPGVFVLQREFVQRMSASPGGKDYGRLTVAIQNRFHARAGEILEPKLFHPSPGVESQVVILSPRPDPPPVDLEALRKMTGICFFSRRKTIFNNLKSAHSPERIKRILADLGVDERARPETLSPDLYARLTLAFLEA